MKIVDAPNVAIVAFALSRSNANVTMQTNPYTGATTYTPRGPGRFRGIVTFATEGIPGSTTDRALLEWLTSLESGDVTKLTLPGRYYAPQPAPPANVAAVVTSTALSGTTRTITANITNAGSWDAVGPFITVGDRLHQVVSATGDAGARVFGVWPNIAPVTNEIIELAAPSIMAQWEEIPSWGPSGAFVLPLTLSFIEHD